MEDHLELSHWLAKALRDAHLTVETAHNGADADALLHTQEYSLVLLDLTLPKMDGLDCLREIKSRWPEAKVIVLTMHEDENYIKQAMQAGAAAYVHKSAADTDLFKAIDAVQAGQLYLSQQDSSLLLHVLLKQDLAPVDNQAPFVLLSPREREVLRLIAHGYSMAEVAERLSLSIKTVDTYKTRLMEKLGTTKKSELVSYALKYGLLSNE